MLDVDIVAESKAIETSLARRSLYSIDELEMSYESEIAMSSPQSLGPDEVVVSQVIMGMEPWELIRSMSCVENVCTGWFNNARFGHV